MGTITQRIEDDAHEVMNEGRGLCRVLAVGVLLAVATVAGCVVGVVMAEEDAAKSEVAATNIVERSEQCNGTGGL